MTQPIRRIIVAVKDVRSRSSGTLRKAAKLARALDAKLELFHAITEPIVLDSPILASPTEEKIETRERSRYLKRLESLAAPLRRNGLDVSTAVDWDYPAHEALIRRARHTQADLIIAERHSSRHVAPWLLRYTDWELLRQSPVPVLLIKTFRQYDSPKVLAAIDPQHALANTARLDDEILGLGARICAGTRGQLHAVHAYVPNLLGMSPKELSAPEASVKIVMQAAALAKEKFDKVLRKSRLGKLSPERRHLLVSHAVDAIPALARKLDCDLVVMGAISRSGLKRLAVGNTAERLLDDLPCDLLIVKPPGFVTSVAARPRGPQLIFIPPTYGAF